MIESAEEWRAIVEEVLLRLLERYPSRKSLLNDFKLSISDTVDIILAIIQKESSGNPLSVGDNGNSYGLMQLNYGAGTPQGEGFTGQREDLFNPETNIYYGIKYFLRKLYEEKDVSRAILAYNAGSYITNKSGVPINQSYLDKVIEILSEKKTLFSSYYSSSESTSSEKVSGWEPDRVIPITTQRPSVSRNVLSIVFIVGMIETIIVYFISC